MVIYAPIWASLVIKISRKKANEIWSSETLYDHLYFGYRIQHYSWKKIIVLFRKH